MAKRRLTRNKPKRNLTITYTSPAKGPKLPASKTWTKTPLSMGKVKHKRSLGKGYTAEVTEDPRLRLYTWKVKNSRGTVVASGTMSTGPITTRLKRAKTAATSAGRGKLPGGTKKKKATKKKATKKKATKKKATKKRSTKKRATKKKATKKKATKKRATKKRATKKSSAKKSSAKKCFTAAEWAKIQKLISSLKTKTKARKGDTAEVRAKKARAAALLRAQLKELRSAAACRLGQQSARARGQTPKRGKCPTPPRSVPQSAAVLGYARARKAGEKTKSAAQLAREFMKS